MEKYNSMLVQQIKEAMVKVLDPDDIVDLLGIDSQTLVDKFDTAIYDNRDNLCDALDLYIPIDSDDEVVEEQEPWDS